MDKSLKYTLIGGIIVVTLSIAYFLIIFIPQKEKARVEQQKQEQQLRQETETVKAQETKIQQQKEYASKRRSDCLQIYKTESDKWNNVESYEYNEKNDQCSVIYRNTNVKKSQEICNQIQRNTIKGLDDVNISNGSSPEDIANEAWIDCMNNVTRNKF